MSPRAWVILFATLAVLLTLFPSGYRVLLSLAIVAAIVLLAPSL